MMPLSTLPGRRQRVGFGFLYRAFIYRCQYARAIELISVLSMAHDYSRHAMFHVAPSPRRTATAPPSATLPPILSLLGGDG